MSLVSPEPRKVATPPSSAPSRSSTFDIPMISIDIWHATMRTPCSCAWAMSSSSEAMPFLRIMNRIILGPMPSMFMREGSSLKVPLGIMAQNMRSRAPFATCTFVGLRRMLRPQNVKNSVTLRPIAAAPLAMTNAAIVLSRSPEKMTKVLLWPTFTFAGSVWATAPCVGTVPTRGNPEPSPLRILTWMVPSASVSSLSSGLPVRSHHAAMSAQNASSVASTSEMVLGVAARTASPTLTMGPGHLRPRASMSAVAGDRLLAAGARCPAAASAWEGDWLPRRGCGRMPGYLPGAWLSPFVAVWRQPNT